MDEEQKQVLIDVPKKEFNNLFLFVFLPLVFIILFIIKPTPVLAAQQFVKKKVKETITETTDIEKPYRVLYKTIDYRPKKISRTIPSNVQKQLKVINNKSFTTAITQIFNNQIIVDIQKIEQVSKSKTSLKELQPCLQQIFQTNKEGIFLKKHRISSNLIVNKNLVSSKFFSLRGGSIVDKFPLPITIAVIKKLWDFCNSIFKEKKNSSKWR